MKKVIRTCVYTRVKEEKSKMLRLVKNLEGKYVLDLKMKAQQRGIYIYPCEEVIKLIEKNKKYEILEVEKEKIIKMIKVGGNNE